MTVNGEINYMKKPITKDQYIELIRLLLYEMYGGDVNVLDVKYLGWGRTIYDKKGFLTIRNITVH